jgi:anti-sigma factor RsiW
MMGCPDVERLFHPYLDGELLGDDCALVEEHIASCAGCREKVAFQSRFKADLRSRLRAPREAPAHLLASVRGALDQADARGEGPAPGLAARWRRTVPASLGVVAAAAAIAFFVVTSRPSQADSAIVEEAIRGHEKNLPIEVGGPNVSDDEIRSWMQGKVAVPVRPLRVRDAGSHLVGARVYHLRNRDAAQLVYRIGPSQMTVYVFDASGFDLATPQARRRLIATKTGQREVYFSEERGYTVALYRDRGVGYAVASDLEPEGLMRLVAASLNE